MTGRVPTLVSVVLFSAMVACSKKQPEPTAAQAAVNAKIAAHTAAPSATPSASAMAHGTRKLMGLDTPVFIDGVQAAVLRYGEMPVVPEITLEGGTKRYRVYDYLKAIGVAPEKLKAVHFHGNEDRIGSIEGSELLREKDRFLFQFTSGDTGAPVQIWDTEGLKNTFVVNDIRRVTAYVQKAPPAVHPQKRCHLDDKGACTDVIAYSNGEIAKGTRIYVDGKMVGFVKRRQVGDALAMGETPSGEAKFSVSKLVAQLGTSLEGVTDVELVAGDDVIARATGSAWTKLAPELSFTLPKHNHGKVRIHVPSEIQAKDEPAEERDALVSAVLLYKRTRPTDRALVAISERTDLSVQLAAIDDARDRTSRGER